MSAMLKAADKCSFYNLLERELREAQFFAKIKAVSRARDCITLDVAVDSIFLLVDEILVIHEFVAELEKIRNKFIRYTEIKYLVTEVARLIELHMKFECDGNLTNNCILKLKDILDSYARSMRAQRDAKLKRAGKNGS